MVKSNVRDSNKLWGVSASLWYFTMFTCSQFYSINVGTVSTGMLKIPHSCRTAKEQLYVDSGSFCIPNLCFQMHLLNNCLLDVFWIAVAKILFTKKITFFNTLSLVATSSLILSYDNALRYWNFSVFLFI